MKLEIKSKQIYETHVDNELTETHECEIELFEDGFVINYGLNSICLKDDVLSINRESTSLKIENGKSNVSKLSTPYGNIQLEVTGESLSFNKNPFLLEVRYKIKIGNTDEYINEIQVVVT